MIKAVIIDDEQNNLDNLFQLLQRHCPEVQVAACALNAEDGRRIIAEQDPELVFLDIQMPGRNGFDLLLSLPFYQFEIIFVTAFDRYGIQAVKFAALDYLLKPIDTAELKTAVHKAVAKSHQKRQKLQLENLLGFLKNTRQKEEHRIALATSRETRFERTQDIIHCESSNNYTMFILAGDEKLLVSKPIFEYEEILGDYGFIRCHQSHLVNRSFIKSWIKEDGGYLLLEDGFQVPISGQKKEALKELLAGLK